VSKTTSQISLRIVLVFGVNSDGFKTTVFPAAIAPINGAKAN